MRCKGAEWMATKQHHRKGGTALGVRNWRPRSRCERAARSGRKEPGGAACRGDQRAGKGSGPWGSLIPLPAIAIGQHGDE